jgi:hypothetical protein
VTLALAPRRLRWVLPLALVAASGAPSRADACAVAPPQGALVTVAAESAIIVWDEATKTEHFVRRAAFRSEVTDFGFLVPTPGKPELSAVADSAFARLEDAVRPETVYQPTWSVEPTALLFMFFGVFARSKGAAVATVAPVRVLEEKRVAGYDAVVLEADDAGALAAWLKEHGYAQRAALAEWLAPYVQQRWKLTAFKIAAEAGAPEPERGPTTLGTEAVRMTFHTERPFFPYREPRDQRESLPPTASTPRSLRVFFVGGFRASATIGEGGTVFPGKTTWAGPLDAARVALPVPAPEGAWLTVIEDDASPRPGTDELWLARAKDQGVVKPPPFVIEDRRRLPIPLDLLALLGGVGVFIARHRRKKRNA